MCSSDLVTAGQGTSVGAITDNLSGEAANISTSGTATLSSTTTLTPTFVAPASGPVVLRLTANDGSQSTSSTTTVYVNHAPVVSVGSTTVSVVVGSSAAFTATATDADLPPNNLTFALVSGPAGLTVSSSVSTGTSISCASFSSVGASISPSRFSSRVLPSGQKARAAASRGDMIIDEVRLFDTVEAAIADLDPSATYQVYCHSGRRSALATALLADHGFAHVTDLGGIAAAEDSTGLGVVQGG